MERFHNLEEQLVSGQGAVALGETFVCFLAGFLVVLKLLRAIGELAWAIWIA